MRSAARANRGLVVLAILSVGWATYPMVRQVVLAPEASTPLRGRELASALGCFACHGPEGRGGIVNPGSRRDTVPGFTGGTLMMYVENDAEIRQYILDGRPDRLADDPEHRDGTEAQALRMPAWRGILAPGEVELLVAYIRTVSGLIEPRDEAAARGLALAQRMGCFGCHGALGMGGRANPRSLKGYIPGFLGEDFDDLVRDDGELREWIRKGRLSRVEESWAARWFTRRQAIQMPAYERFLADGDLDDLVALVRWLRSGAPQKEPLS